MTPPIRTWTFPEARPKTAGPWSTEPDKAQWVDEATGLDCLIVRNHGGALCGYVGLPPGHPLHGLDYDEAHERADIDVHGGLTFADRCQKGDEDGWHICHVPEPGRPAEVWWLGFDCAHFGDISPRHEQDYRDAGIDKTAWGHSETYKDFGYVQAEVTRLAAQLAIAASAS